MKRLLWSEKHGLKATLVTLHNRNVFSSTRLNKKCRQTESELKLDSSEDDAIVVLMWSKEAEPSAVKTKNHLTDKMKPE